VGEEGEGGEVVAAAGFEVVDGEDYFVGLEGGLAHEAFEEGQAGGGFGEAVCDAVEAGGREYRILLYLCWVCVWLRIDACVVGLYEPDC
jgi:hypothetical protein